MCHSLSGTWYISANWERACSRRGSRRLPPTHGTASCDLLSRVCSMPPARSNTDHCARLTVVLLERLHTGRSASDRAAATTLLLRRRYGLLSHRSFGGAACHELCDRARQCRWLNNAVWRRCDRSPQPATHRRIDHRIRQQRCAPAPSAGLPVVSPDTRPSEPQSPKLPPNARVANQHTQLSGTLQLQEVHF